MVVLGAVVSFAALSLYEPPAPEMPTARVERRDFVRTVRGPWRAKKRTVATDYRSTNAGSQDRSVSRERQADQGRRGRCLV